MNDIKHEYRMLLLECILIKLINGLLITKHNTHISPFFHLISKNPHHIKNASVTANFTNTQATKVPHSLTL